MSAAGIIRRPGYDIELSRAPEDGRYYYEVTTPGRPRIGDGWFDTSAEAIREADAVAGIRPRLYPVRRAGEPKRPGDLIRGMSFTIEIPARRPLEWLPLVDLEAADVEALTGEHRRACLAEMRASLLAIEDGEIVSVDPAHGVQSAEVAA